MLWLTKTRIFPLTCSWSPAVAGRQQAGVVQHKHGPGWTVTVRPGKTLVMRQEEQIWSSFLDLFMVVEAFQITLLSHLLFHLLSKQVSVSLDSRLTRGLPCPWSLSGLKFAISVWGIKKGNCYAWEPVRVISKEPVTVREHIISLFQLGLMWSFLLFIAKSSLFLQPSFWDGVISLLLLSVLLSSTASFEDYFSTKTVSCRESR